MTEVEPAVPPRRRHGTAMKAVLGSAVLALVLIAGFAAVVAPNLADEPEFDDSDLIAAPPSVPAGEDAGPGMALALDSILGEGLERLGAIELGDAEGAGPDGTLRSASVRAGLAIFGGGSAGGGPRPPPDPAAWSAYPHRGEIESALAAESEFFAAIDEACRRPRCSLPEWSDPHDVLRDWPLSVQRGLELLQLRSDAAFASGDRAAAVEADLALLRFVARRVEGARFIGDHAVSLSLLDMSVDVIGRHLQAGIFAGNEARLAAELGQISLGRGLVSRAIREEYRWQRTQVEDTGDYLTEALPSTLARWSFHPNETLRILGEHYRAAIAEGEETGRVTTPPPDRPGSAFGRLLRGNPIGFELITPLISVDLGAFYGSVDQSIGDLNRLRERVEAAREDR